MPFKIENIRHHKEKKYSKMLLVFGCILWGIFALFLIASILKQDFIGTAFIIIYVVMFLCVSYIARALTQAYMFGHYVMISPEQFPHLHQMVKDGSQKVGLKEAPQAFIYNSHGIMNAMAVRLVGRTRYIWLTSAIIDADSDDQIRFVIGHELGHHVAGHLNVLKFILQLPGHCIPFLGKAYSRNRELTCDRIGAFVTQDISVARSALQMLACGSTKLNTTMNPIAFQNQEQMVPQTAGYILHIFSYYPRLTQRVKDVTLWYASFKNK